MSQEELFQVFNKAYEFIKRHSIHDVRNLAREFGVKSPTSSKKDAIAAELIAIAAGITSPKERSTKGAKSKAAKVPESMLLEFKTLIREGVMLFSYDDVQKVAPQILQFNDSGVSTAQDIQSKQPIEVSIKLGVLDCVEERYYLREMDYTRRENDCIVPKEFITKFSLKKGDILECSVERRNQQFIVSDLRTINSRLPFLHYRNDIDFDSDFSNQPAVRFELGQKSNPLIQAVYTLLPISKGSQIAISKQNIKNSNLLLHILKTLQGSVLSFALFIFQEENFETETLIKNNFPFVTILSCKNLTTSAMLNAMYLLLEQRKRAIEFGTDVVFLIDDMHAMLEFFEKVENLQKKQEVEQENISAKEQLKEFLSTAKIYNNIGSLTIGVLFEENANSLALIHEVMPKCDAHIFFKEFSDAYMPDFKKSYSLHFKELLSKQEQETANRLKTLTNEEIIAYFENENTSKTEE